MNGNGTVLSLLARAAKNKHTSGAALVYGFAKLGMPILTVWFPAYKSKIDATASALEGLAVSWGFLTAGDAQKSVSQEDLDATKKEFDTKLFTKSDVQPPKP